MSHSFRTATPSDGLACARIIRAWGAEMSWMAPLDDLAPMSAFWAEMIEEYPAWMAERDGIVVGFCLRDDDNIGGLYVAREHRRPGLGKRLLEFAREGCERIVVWAYEANAGARRFYRREELVEGCWEREESSQLMNVEHHWTRPR